VGLKKEIRGNLMQDERNNQIILDEITLKTRDHIESMLTEYFSGSDFQLESRRNARASIRIQKNKKRR